MKKNLLKGVMKNGYKDNEKASIIINIYSKQWLYNFIIAIDKSKKSKINNENLIKKILNKFQYYLDILLKKNINELNEIKELKAFIKNQ
tara:strand:+ start:465 stop:731 length:267 start_codon:yes stop_codon:yes gene_type:complete